MRKLYPEITPNIAYKTLKSGNVVFKKMLCVKKETLEFFVAEANKRRANGEPILSGGVMAEILENIANGADSVILNRKAQEEVRRAD